MNYRIETRNCLIDDIEIVDQCNCHLVLLNCVTDAGKHFTVAIKPKPLGQGWGYEQFRLIQMMLKSYDRECSASARDHCDFKPVYAGLLGLFFKLRLRVGAKTKGTRPITIEKFKRCAPFELPEVDVSVEDMMAMMEAAQ